MALESDADGGGGSRGKRRRVDEHGARRRDAAAAAAVPVVRISALPDDLRQRVLRHLPLRDAIRTAALAQGWRDLWRSRWAHPTSCRDLRVLPGDHPREALRSLERGRRPRPRLDRLSLVVDNDRLRPQHLRRLLAYAAACRVGDLRVDLRHCRRGAGLFAAKFNYQFARSSPLLAHLSLRRVNICNVYSAQPLRALEVICLDSVTIGVSFGKITALCPRLRALDVRRCRCGDIFYGGEAFASPAGASLRSVTVVECTGEIRLDVETVPGLRSLRYSGGILSSPVFLRDDVALNDLYVRLTDRDNYGVGLYCDFKRVLRGDLSGLTVLTICSKALKIASYLLNDQTSQWAKLSNLQSLRELQLLMFGTQTENLADIYVFLNASQCPCLERLFVQLPDICDVPLVDLLEGVGAAPPEKGLHNLRTVKVMNFNWHRFEVQLVSFLLRKASSLDKLLLVSPNVTPQHVPGVPEADLLLIEEALAGGHIVLSESDDAAIQPFHSEAFTKA
ncbi:hypothetical protein ACP4OV_013813 [Aristida adscensionis]